MFTAHEACEQPDGEVGRGGRPRYLSGRRRGGALVHAELGRQAGATVRTERLPARETDKGNSGLVLVDGKWPVGKIQMYGAEHAP